MPAERRATWSVGSFRRQGLDQRLVHSVPAILFIYNNQTKSTSKGQKREKNGEGEGFAMDRYKRRAGEFQKGYNYFAVKNMEGNQILLKLISVGDTKVGKSCIIKRFVQKYITTIGVDYGVKKVTVSSRKIAVNFFDLSGSADYQQIRNPFYADAQVILLVFDLQNRESFNNLSKWEGVMKNYGVNAKDSVIMLVGNKCDGRTKEVDPTQAIAYAKKKGYEYFQVSASTGENINEVFEKAFNRAVSAMQDKRKTLT